MMCRKAITLLSPETFILLSSMAYVVYAHSTPLQEQQPLLLETMITTNDETKTPHNPLDADFAKLVHKTLDHYHVPCTSIAIIHNGHVFSQGYGYSILPDTKAAPETMYLTASTTKSFTAAILSLIMDDQATNNTNPITWQTRITDIPGLRDDFVLPDPYATSHCTLEDAASHRTGMPGHDLAFGGNGENDITSHTVKATTRSLRHLPPSREFRTTFQYNNMFFAVLQHIAESLSNGTWLGDLLLDRIWKPLGMQSTYFSNVAAEAASKKHVAETGKGELARGYLWDDHTSRYMPVPYYEISEIAGAGAIVSTVLDYAKYLRMMISQSPPLSKHAHAELRKARSIAKPDFDGDHPERNGRVTYALGWIGIPYRGVEILQHNGGLPGFGTLMAYVPALNWGVAFMGNTASTSSYASNVLFYHLLDNLLDVPADKRVNNLALGDAALAAQSDAIITARKRLFPSGSIPDPPLPLPRALEDYAGTYTHPGYRNFTFSVTTPAARTPSPKPSQVLRANATDRTFPFALELEHVSGEYFLVWLIGPRGYVNGESDEIEEGPGVGGIDNVEQGMHAVFRVGENGKVVELGMALEQSLSVEEKIWFRRVEG